MRSLVVKMSALGDIVQAFSVLAYLKSLGPVDWVVEEKFSSLVRAHPLVDRVIAIDSKKPSSWNLRALRKYRYDAIYDLQGNCKSGLFTLLARGSEKIGFTLKQNAEWPNRLALSKGVKIDPSAPIRNQYRAIVQASDCPPSPLIAEEVPPFDRPTLMICAGSNWQSKRLNTSEWIDLLKPIDSAQFLFVWKSEAEKEFALSLQDALGGITRGDLSLPTWQAVMRCCIGVVSVDSCALHLAVDGGVPAYGFFGPSSGAIYGPEGAYFQGACPFGETFTKRCPRLRTCQAPCMRNPESAHFHSWYNALSVQATV